MDYFVFKFLWVIVLLPKTMQLGWFGIIALVLMCKNNSKCIVKRDSVNFSFLLPNIILLFSIIISLLVRTHDVKRILAAVNTCLITFIAVEFYNWYLKADMDYAKISRYMFINFMILGMLCLLYRVLGVQTPSILGRTLGSMDYIYGIQTTRFSAYLEYVNLVVYFCIYTFSMSIYYAYKHLNNILYLIYSLLPMWIVIATNSRTGFPIAVMLSFVAIGVRFCNVLYSYFTKNRYMFIAVMILLLFMVIVLFHSSISNVLLDAIVKREGSTNTRKALYIASIQKMLEESPIIGCGIKDIWNNLPYGSHSTFLGMFYKTGILGGTVFLCGMVVTTFKIFKMKIYTKNVISLKIAYYCLIAISMLEDLDGSDWNIVLFMVFLAVLKKQDLRKEIFTRGFIYEHAGSSEYNCSGI